MKSKFLTLAVAAMLAVNAGAVLAQDEKALSPAVVQQLDLINRLVALGDARKDPLLLLLAAASIQKSLARTPLPRCPARAPRPTPSWRVPRPFPLAART